MSSVEPPDDRCGHPLADAARCPTCGRADRYCEATPLLGRAYRQLGRCRIHAGIPPDDAQRKGQLVHQLRRWGLTEQSDLADPEATHMRLINQTTARVDLYSAILADAYTAGQRLKDAQDMARAAAAVAQQERTQPGGVLPGFDDHLRALDAELEARTGHPAVHAALADLDRILNRGGVAALIGPILKEARDGSFYTAEERITALAELEMRERAFLHQLLNTSFKSDVANRMVAAQERIADAQAMHVVAVVFAVLRQFGVEADQDGVRTAVATQLREIETAAVPHQTGPG